MVRRWTNMRVLKSLTLTTSMVAFWILRWSGRHVWKSWRGFRFALWVLPARCHRWNASILEFLLDVERGESREGAAEGFGERVLAWRTEQLRGGIQCREVSEEVRVIWKLSCDGSDKCLSCRLSGQQSCLVDRQVSFRAPGLVWSGSLSRDHSKFLCPRTSQICFSSRCASTYICLWAFPSWRCFSLIVKHSFSELFLISIFALCFALLLVFPVNFSNWAMFVSIHSTSSLRKRGFDTRHFCIHLHSLFVSACDVAVRQLKCFSWACFSRDLFTSFCCSSQQLLYIVLCSWIQNSASHGSCRSWLSMLLLTSLRFVQNRFAQIGWYLERPLLMAFGSEDVFTDLLEFSFHFRDVFFRVPRLLLFVLFSFVVCKFFLSVSNFSCRLSFMLSFDDFLDLNLHLVFFVLLSSAICNCLLHLLLFLFHFPFNSAAFSFSTTICAWISIWCFLVFSAIFNFCSAAMRWWQSVSLFLVIGQISFFDTVFSSYVSACNWHCSFCSFDAPLLLGMLLYLLLGMFFCLLLAMFFCLLFALLFCLFFSWVRFSWVFCSSSSKFFASVLLFGNMTLLLSLIFFTIGSSGCGSVSVLCLLASLLSTLLCGS